MAFLPENKIASPERAVFFVRFFGYISLCFYEMTTSPSGGGGGGGGHVRFY